MIAYYVHDDKKENDVIVIPNRECAVPVDRERLEAFISVDPLFASGREMPAAWCRPKILVL